MRYAEFATYDRDEKLRIIESLSDQQFQDLRDERPVDIPGWTGQEDKGVIYFDTIQELHEYILHHIAPSAKPWEANEAANHELAHAHCALDLGATGVKYFVTDFNKTDLNQVYVDWYGPVTLPALAMAAIAVHPFDAGRSITDMRTVRKVLRYQSRNDVIGRIHRWNDRLGGELHIPEPQTAHVDLLKAML